MIKSITIINFKNEKLIMDLRNPEKSGFLIKKITGLGPCKADINAKELATQDGSVYNSARINSRNIVMSIIYCYKPTIEDTRQLSYKFFAVKKQIKIIIETDNRICEATGYIESNEPDIFSSQEGTQISIICPDPYFYSSGENGKQVHVFSGIEPAFEFPLINDSISEKLIELGIATYSSVRNIFYKGDSEVGIIIRIHAIGDVKNITILNRDTNERMILDTTKLETLTGKEIVEGDDVIISTIKGDKYIKLFREGKEYNILNCLDKQSDWFRLSYGDNIFVYTADEGASNLEFKIENRIIYEGV